MVSWIWIPVTVLVSFILFFKFGPKLLIPVWCKNRSKLYAELCQERRNNKKLSDKLGAKQGV
jgi:hypothetical protein